MLSKVSTALCRWLQGLKETLIDAAKLLLLLAS